MTTAPEPLDLVVGSLLPRDRPFTRRQVAATGMTRARFERLVADGVLDRVLPGVYADAAARHDVGFRAEAARLLLRGDPVVTGRAAAWVHGLHEVPSEVGRRRRDSLPGRDVTEVRGTAVTTPARTVLDLARDDDERVALAVADRAVRRLTVPHTALLASLATVPEGRVRALLAQVDGRATSAAESVLRMHWHASSLPTPAPGLVVPGRRGAVRLTLGVPTHRFGALLRSRLGGPDSATEDVAALRERGWWLVDLDDAQVLASPAELVRRHLEREYHQALLAEVG